MAKRKVSNASSDRQKWEKVFNLMVNMLQTQQRERELLEDRIDEWISDINLYKDQISQLKRNITVLEMLRNVDAKKLDLLVGLKQRDAFIYKSRLDNAVNDMKDFRAVLDYLNQKCSENEGNTSQLSALISERDFVWNQYKKRENDLTDKLKSKNKEIEQANEKMKRLLQDMEQLNSSNSEKDNMILKLRSDISKLEATLAKKSEENTRLSGELHILGKARSNSTTPLLRRCSVDSRVGDKNKSAAPRDIAVKKESHPSRTLEKGTGSSKRKAADSIPVSVTPKLFTSSFKVPKLKSSSSPHVI